MGGWVGGWVEEEEDGLVGWMEGERVGWVDRGRKGGLNELL